MIYLWSYDGTKETIYPIHVCRGQLHRIIYEPRDVSLILHLLANSRMTFKLMMTTMTRTPGAQGSEVKMSVTQMEG